MEPDVLPLVPVCSEHFAHKVINSEEECTVEEFCKQNNYDKSKSLQHFPYYMEDLPEGMREQPIWDAILMDRVFNSYIDILVTIIVHVNIVELLLLNNVDTKEIVHRPQSPSNACQ